MLQAAKKVPISQPLVIRFPCKIARGVAGLAAAEQPATQIAQGSPHPVVTKLLEHDEFWRIVPTYQDISKKDFLSYRWSVS